MNSKPRIVKAQRMSDVTCVYNSYCNFYDIKNLSEKDFRSEFLIYWGDLPSTKRMNDLQRNGLLNALIGPMGYSMDLLKMMLRRRGQTFKEVGANLNVDFTTFASNVENGFLSVFITESKNFKFAHCIAIKNGYIMDSIGAQVYPWKGAISGYKKVDFISAIDCDDMTFHQALRAGDNALVIDLS